MIQSYRAVEVAIFCLLMWSVKVMYTKQHEQNGMFESQKQQEEQEEEKNTTKGIPQPSPPATAMNMTR
ncbi:hypothetical protein VTJ04DRAFT_5917 [Mycothermus thermophilus]|uniref:uncharacterized protein n=1 Tax=Humicola insolens TaxID=85995 RepID=UPI003743E9CC